MKKLVFLLLLSVLAACSIKYVPVAAPDIIISEDIALYNKPDISLAIENRYWIKEPDNLSDYFTTFYITISNKTRTKIELQPSEISLLDQYGNQFDVVSLDYIEDMLLPDDFELKISQQIEGGDPNLVDEWRDAKQNLITYSFHFGSILPGARKSGFIFYPKLASRNDECSIIFRDKRIRFVRNDRKKE